MPKRIIIIEDDRDILDMMTYILKDEGYDIISSTDCSPLEDLPASQPDLILMDNRLHDGSGMDECRKLKAQDSTRPIPVVIVSANPQLPRLAAECLADGYVSKPFDLQELIAVVRRYTGS
jgi:DNA-binding response OmpR family regulator